MKKRIWFTLAGAVIGLLLLSVNAFAAADFGGDEIMNALPEEVADYMMENDITAEEINCSALNVQGFFEQIWGCICEGAEKPLKMLAGLVGVIFLCAVISVLRDSTGSSSLTEAFELVGVLAGSGIVCGYMGEVIEAAKNAINGMSAFLLSYVPAFAGVMAVNGQAGTAAAYNSAVIAASELFSQITAVFLFPLASAVMGISVAASVNPDLHISAISDGIKKIVVWAIGFMMTIFTGLLSVQSFVASASDSVSLRTAKYTVSNSVPIVGGAVSDALAAVSGSISFVKSNMGGFGIIAGAGIILPSLITAVCFRFALVVAGAAGKLFGTDKLSSLLKSGESVLDIIIAMLVCFGLLTVISTALMLALGKGG